MSAVRRLGLTCNTCGAEKPISEFRAGCRRCRVCERRAHRERYRAIPDDDRLTQRRLKAARRSEKIDVTEYNRAYLRRNYDQALEKNRSYHARRFFWSKAQRLNGEARPGARDLAALWKMQRGRCALSGRRLDRRAHLDHRLAKSRGGGDEIGNLQWLCPEVNLAKRALTEAEFIALCREVSVLSLAEWADETQRHLRGRQ